MEGERRHSTRSDGSGSLAGISMSVVVRIRREFHAALVSDLQRQHPIAHERVGWIFAKHALAGREESLLFPVEYKPVEDENYVPDRSVGACFNATAIRAALQHSRSTGLSCLQVHLHDHSGHTGFSGIDIATIDELAPSFRSIAPATVQGGLVLSRDSATARIWLPGLAKPARSRVVIVGFPMRLVPEAS